MNMQQKVQPGTLTSVDATPRIRCRQIKDSDLGAITDLLSVGFPRKSRDHWAHVLDVLTRRAPADGFPKYGYMLETGATPVGVLLILSTKLPDTNVVRCNGSAWYVTPAFRSFAPFLISKSLKGGAIHTNLWPDPATLPTIEALGFKRYCDGAFAALPALAGGVDGVRITRVENSVDPEVSIPATDLRRLRDHDGFGCLSLWCEAPDGGHGFIFRRRTVKALPSIQVAQLIYCPSIDGLVRLAGPIGRYLIRLGMPILIMPANGPVPRLVGKYFKDKTMYCLGAEAPDIGDLAYSKAAMFEI